MRFSMNWLHRVATIACLSLGAALVSSPARSVEFEHQEMDQSKIVAIASPYGDGLHQLLIVEQISAGRLCWSEAARTKTGMIVVNPLLRDFDFTGICRRSTDSNGYSVRLAGKDMGWRYGLRVIQRDGDLLLVALSTAKRISVPIVIGRAKGDTDGFAKLQLDPGWRMTHRAYNGQITGHIYLTHDQSLQELQKASQ
jgi:hypothetical protein